MICYFNKNLINESLLLEADNYHKRARMVIARYYPNFSQAQINALEEAFRKEYYTGRDYPNVIRRLESIFLNIALGLGYAENDKSNYSIYRLNLLKQIFNEIKRTRPNTSSWTESNTTFSSLMDIYGADLIDSNKIENAQLNMIDWGSLPKGKYEILKDVDYETAYKIGEWTGWKGDGTPETGQLCYTRSPYTWNNYTKGGNKVYVLLREGWKDMIAPEEPNFRIDDDKEVPGEIKTELIIDDDTNQGKITSTGFGEYPYDAYGLSVIFVFISPSGGIAYSNTRWNHGKGMHLGDVDHSFSKPTLSYLLGENVNNVFDIDLENSGDKYDRITKEIQNLGILPIDAYNDTDAFEKLEALYSVLNPHEIFDRGNLSGSRNQLLMVQDKSEGRYGYLNLENGRFIIKPDSFIKNIEPFKNGYSLVTYEYKCSYIDENGIPLDTEEVGDSNILASAKDGFNFTDEGYGFLILTAYDDSKKLLIIDKNANLMFGSNRGIYTHPTIISDNHGHMKIQPYGVKYTFEVDCDKGTFFYNGKQIPIPTTRNIVENFNEYSKVGMLTVDEVFDIYSSDEDPIKPAKLVYNLRHAFPEFDEKPWFYLDCEKIEILGRKHFCSASGFYRQKFAPVGLEPGKYTYINREGELLPEEFDKAEIFMGVFGCVKKDGKYNYITDEGKLASPDIWFDEAETDSPFSLKKVKIGDGYNLLWKGGLVFPYTLPYIDKPSYTSSCEIKLQNGEEYYIFCDAEDGLEIYQHNPGYRKLPPDYFWEREREYEASLENHEIQDAESQTNSVSESKKKTIVITESQIKRIKNKLKKGR